jgi:GT2 family glycosyltransferase
MSRPAPPDVSFILVNYNDRVHLEACLDAIRTAGPSTSREVILIDNASADGSADFIAFAFPEVRLIRNEANVGFSTANNQGVRASRSKFLLFLNTDTVMKTDALSSLIAEIIKSPDAGAVGPALLHGQGRYQVSFGRRVDFVAQFFQKAVINSSRKLQLRFARKSLEVGWLSAACLLCRREAFEAVGGFDERFFLYIEDIDLCLRMRKAGWRLLYIPRARVFHAGGATTAPRRPSSRLEYRKSQLYFYEKHNSRTSLRLLRAYLRLIVAAFGAAGRFRGPEGRRLGQEYRGMLARVRRAG